MMNTNENDKELTNNSEKLFDTLLLPLIPVYYGDPTVPNITKTPSFIKASDFLNPHALAKHLLYLDSHPAEYAKYHAWRTDVHSFTESYLNEVKNLPGPTERKLHQLGATWTSDRKAMCCRLCNEDYLRQRIRERKGQGVNHTLSFVDIQRKFYRSVHP